MSTKTKTKVVAKPEPEALSRYVADASEHPGFRYARYFWRENGPKCGITTAVLAKLQPAGHPAARHDLLLPAAAAGEYADLDYLLTRYDATQPLIERNGYVQYTIDLLSDRPVHAGWELVREWVMAYFVRELQLAALLVLHMPFRAGSANASHIHILIPARRIGPDGFGAHARSTCSDQGFKDGLNSWMEFQTVQTPAPVQVDRHQQRSE
ncbi:hypothetical protein VVT58_06480 [Sphingobium sp. SJ10-10]|uniref:hypothetical protein n=1 Tax=Sphingobium sp. SJ10-10 TaxID=3114999 RepID=UPI002E16CD76|nr:hypothetical protein [Sphingobium sp. SJ10-10]